MTKNRRHDIVKPSKFKTSMCTFFLSAEGCPFGDKCAFAHGEDELRSDPKESAAAADGAAVTSSPTSSNASEHGEAGTSAKGRSRSHHDPHNASTASATAPTAGAAAGGAKKRGKKNRMEASTTGSAMGASLHSLTGGKGEAAQARCRPQRRTMPPPPPLPPASGPMPSAAYSLSVAPPHPAAYAVYGDFSMAYGGLPAMPGMPYYIPTVGNHPFSNINNNHHAVNVAPHMHSPMPLSAMAGPPLAFPPPPVQPSPMPQTSMPSSPSPLTHGMAAAVLNNSSTPPGAAAGAAPPTPTTAAAAAAGGVQAEDGKRRQRQPLRHVVSSNTMAHSHGRHSAPAAAAEVASPQYVYGLMAAAGVPLTASPAPHSAAASDRAGSGGVPTPLPPSSSTQQQPRLIVVPHQSGSGGFVVPSNVKNYPPQPPVAPHSDPNSPVGGTSEGGAAASGRGASATAAVVSPVMAAPAAAASPDVFFQQVRASPQPPTIVHIPLSSGSPTSDLAGGSGKTIGDALWGPAGGGTVNPLTTPTLPTVSDDASSDYNALLSGLGIGGSSYTTIPLDELLGHHPRATREDDDVSAGGDFDWTGALERWLHTAKEESAAQTVKTTPAEAAAAAPVEGAVASAATATYHPQAGQPVTSALNHKPVLMDAEVKAKTAAAEPKRKPAVVCQVSRAGGKPAAAAKRRGPVMTNQFKSSCAAEAESGSVLLYCAEKNTLVYITSAKDAAGPPSATAAAAAALASASLAGSTRTNGESDGQPAGNGEAAVATSPESPTMAGSSLTLGVEVRFNPGRKKRSVLEPETYDDDAEYCI